MAVAIPHPPGPTLPAPPAGSPAGLQCASSLPLTSNRSPYSTSLLMPLYVPGDEDHEYSDLQPAAGSQPITGAAGGGVTAAPAAAASMLDVPIMEGLTGLAAKIAGVAKAYAGPLWQSAQAAAQAAAPADNRLWQWLALAGAAVVAWQVLSSAVSFAATGLLVAAAVALALNAAKR